MCNKICFFISELNNSGGTERVTSLIANALSERGYSVCILSLANGNDPFFPLNPEVAYYSLQKGAYHSAFLRSVRDLRHFVKAERISTLIAVDSILALYTIPATVLLPIKNICWEHFNFKVNLGKKKRALARQFSGIFADVIVTLTARDAYFWQKNLFWQRAKITTIVNPTAYPDTKWQPQLKTRTFLAVGRLTYQKGFDLLLEAWSKALPDLAEGWQLKIVGNGEDKDDLQRYIDTYDLATSVHIEPATKDIVEQYESASFYVMSSRFEGFGLVLVEAHSFALPIISFDCDVGPAEIVADGRSGWLCPLEDVSALAAALVRASHLSLVDYQAFSENARKQAMRFDTKNIVSDWEEAIMSMKMR